MDTTRPPLGIDLATWEAMSWWDRHVVTKRTTPPPPSPTDPPWRLAALELRDRVDAVAQRHGGYVTARTTRTHRRRAA